jgi:uncharacterized membrane protein YphA (DoxX/SURF4 family)
MDTALWIAQAHLAAIFLITGVTKLTQPRAKMAAGPMRWAAGISDAQFRTIGLLEVLAALGLILPAALDVAPAITPLALSGLRSRWSVRSRRISASARAAASRPPIILLALALLVAVERVRPRSL